MANLVSLVNIWSFFQHDNYCRNRHGRQYLSHHILNLVKLRYHPHKEEHIFLTTQGQWSQCIHSYSHKHDDYIRKNSEGYLCMRDTSDCLVVVSKHSCIQPLPCNSRRNWQNGYCNISKDYSVIINLGIDISYKRLNFGIKGIYVLHQCRENITECSSKGWNRRSNQFCIGCSPNSGKWGLFDKWDIEDARFNKRSMCRWLKRTNCCTSYTEKSHQDTRYTPHSWAHYNAYKVKDFQAQKASYNAYTYWDLYTYHNSLQLSNKLSIKSSPLN